MCKIYFLLNEDAITQKNPLKTLTITPWHLSNFIAC